jgi:hypothetical protein
MLEKRRKGLGLPWAQPFPSIILTVAGRTHTVQSVNEKKKKEKN